MKISVIIPVFNEEKYLAKCLDTLLCQSVKIHEIIIIDDGSTDKTSNIANTYINYKNIHYFRLKHYGAASARNYGASKATGSILVFVDGDMYFDKNYIKKLIYPIVNNKADATFTYAESLGNGDNVWAKCFNINNYFSKNSHIQKNIPKFANNFRAIRQSTFFKTKGYLNVGYGEDVTVLSQLDNVKALGVGALCYHFNPSDLKEVYISARWIGRGETIKRNLYSFLVFSPLNSLRRGVIVAVKNKLPEFILFKLVFDLGILCGMFNRIFNNIYKK